jgi:hypothetical protein
MKDLLHKKCEFSGCNINPSFNFPMKNPVYCFKHKKEGMINVKTKYCCHKGCKICASFNFKNNPPMYCYIHREEKMINVKNRICECKDCINIANYNYEGKNTTRFCDKHKLNDMICIKNRQKRSYREIEVFIQEQNDHKNNDQQINTYKKKQKKSNIINYEALNDFLRS